MPIPQPRRGEVQIKIAVSGIHHGDLGKRQGWWGSTMRYPRVIPHGDGAGVIDAAGDDVDRGRIGERVWVHLAQRILAVAPRRGVDRLAEVAFDANLATDLEILACGGVIATYSSGDPNPAVPYFPLGFKNVTVHFLSNDDFPEEANHAAAELTQAVRAGDLRYPIAASFPSTRSSKHTKPRTACPPPAGWWWSRDFAGDHACARRWPGGGRRT